MNLPLTAHSRPSNRLITLITSFSYSAFSVGAALFVLSALHPAANAQTTARCPLVGDISLKQVAAWISKGPETQTVTFIKACHMGFPLDAPALNTLSGSKTTPAIFDALNNATTAALSVDRAHDLAKELESALPSATPAQATLYKRRIDYLERASYVDLNAATFSNYDPKASRLIASLGNDEYWFDNVPAQAEDMLFRNWYKVKVIRSYADDERHTRMLVYGATSFSGYSHKADIALKLAPLLTEAQARMDRKDYAGAKEKYEAALGVDGDNSVASAGSKLADQKIQEGIVTATSEIALGEWTDAKTGLMWTIHGHDANVTFKRAQEFCQNLKLGGHDDWRLPNKEELLGIFDPAPENEKTFRFTMETYTYYIRGKKIQLTRPSVWSSTLDKQGSKNAWFVNLSTGQSAVHYGIGVPELEALCVRGRPDTHQDPLFSPIDTDVFNKKLGFCKQGNAEMCEFVGIDYEEGKVVPKDYDKAMEYYHKSCKMGDSTSCYSAEKLVNKLNKQAGQK